MAALTDDNLRFLKVRLWSVRFGGRRIGQSVPFQPFHASAEAVFQGPDVKLAEYGVGVGNEAL